jgi:putative transposase
MLIPSSMPRLKGYRFPRAIIAYAVWAYHRFALSTLMSRISWRSAA